MDEKTFLERKVSIIDLVNESLAKQNLSEDDIYGLNCIIRVINGYSFTNRIQTKGALTYIILDSLTITDETIKKECYKFDDDIK